nr:hypothetical protein [Tanacetum cinerariifolium]
KSACMRGPFAISIIIIVKMRGGWLVKGERRRSGVTTISRAMILSSLLLLLSVGAGVLRTLKLDLKSVNNGYGRPFVKISCTEIGKGHEELEHDLLLLCQEQNGCQSVYVWSEVEEAVRMISSTYSSKPFMRNCKAKNIPYGSRISKGMTRRLGDRGGGCCKVGGGGDGGVVGGVGGVCGDGLIEELEVLIVELFVGLFVVVFVEEK